ncbi:MAG: hypothetical protein K6F09_04525 [Clostridiales bacterium]|nr:hypothetical protein [Clostridiales bacterium]
MNFRTDLTIESSEAFENGTPEGIKLEAEEKNGIRITRIEVLDGRGEKAIGKTSRKSAFGAAQRTYKNMKGRSLYMERTLAFKIGRAYLAVMLICLCVSAAVCGIIAAGENTEHMTTGEETAVVAGIQNEKSLTLDTGNKIIDIEKPRFLPEILRLLPSPLGNLISVMYSISDIAETASQNV